MGRFQRTASWCRSACALDPSAHPDPGCVRFRCVLCSLLSAQSLGGGRNHPPCCKKQLCFELARLTPGANRTRRRASKPQDENSLVVIDKKQMQILKKQFMVSAHTQHCDLYVCRHSITCSPLLLAAPPTTQPPSTFSLIVSFSRNDA